MFLTVSDALIAYAEMINVGNSEQFESLLSDDFHYASQMVFTEIESKREFVEYIRKKLAQVQSSGLQVFAEIGEMAAYGKGKCVVIAQGTKENLVATVFAETDGKKIKRIDMCVVPPPSAAKRSGNYPGLKSESMNAFISYTTAYDNYTGSKNWNQINLQQRKAIVEFEFCGSDIDYEKLIIESGLKKLQAQGLRSLCVASLMLNERLGLINPDAKGKNDTHHLLSVFLNTKLYKEVNSLLKNLASEKTDYTGEELEKLAQTNTRPSLLDDALDMSNFDAREFIRGQLEKLCNKFENNHRSSEVVQQIFVDNNDPLIVKRKLRRKKGFFDFFVCAEVRWIKESIYEFFDRHEFIVEQQALSEALKYASNSDKAKYSIRVDLMKPEQVALIIIRNIAFNNVSSGLNHVYRGVLSIAGKDYEKMFLCAVKDSVRLGFYTNEDANADVAEMRLAIKNVG